MAIHCNHVRAGVCQECFDKHQKEITSDSSNESKESPSFFEIVFKVIFGIFVIFAILKVGAIILHLT